MLQGWGSREDDYNFLFKIVLVGDSGVGKSCLLSRFAWDQFAVDSKSTIGVEFATKSLDIGNQIVKVQVWDTAGQERYRAITTAYYRDAVGAIVVYDITKEESYNNVVRWVKDVRNNANNRDIAIMLVGNKCDRIKERTVPLESAKAFARNNDLRYENSWLAPAGTLSVFLPVPKQNVQNCFLSPGCLSLSRNPFKKVSRSSQSCFFCRLRI